ncbi:flagellar biosynthesis anti-sigma factor FlgM [Luteitalea sp.]|uniref:flagellar biosynthesis anti-sigma factor FlgM n=1 Tax=Luteitalea sp. TaxID=2004800 RepID=UPI0025BEFB0D|nr:flagellar biosynthesis anti-sigma factor FlgM [Luteitalea sp.]
MKIQGDRPSGVQDAGQTQQVEKAAQQRAQQSRGGVDAGDRVEVSADARLLGKAVDAAAKAPEIRQDVVERAKAKLAAGEIGNDPGRLADRLIDSVLSK